MSQSFRPIAIVGRSCLLPGANSPEELWRAVRAGRDLLSEVPEGRWGISPRSVLTGVDGDRADRVLSLRGGYVDHADLDLTGFAIPADDLAALDPVFTWTLHCAREALRDAGLDLDDAADWPTIGAVFGNLSFPTAAMAGYAGQIWDGVDQPGIDAHNRFSSGLPALMLRRALNLRAGAFALDAACASSLYAIDDACRQLTEGRADVMLAGAVNAADDLFIHMGFSALSALSPSGRSRPFHPDADGLVPAEGAAFVALRRLEDAERDGDVIHGVIRGIGLSNDGKGRGFLVPSTEGQVRALERAYEVAAIDPATISLIECHATGTAIGDRTEITTLREVFDTSASPAATIPIGSLKSNLGHLITVAGVAGLIKVTEAIAARERPPSCGLAEAETGDVGACVDAGPALRVLTDVEPWPADAAQPRRAAVSAFGFGGNNAHLIVEEFVPSSVEQPPEPTREPPIEASPALAVIGIAVRAGSIESAHDLSETSVTAGANSDVARESAGGQRTRIDELTVDLQQAAIPPHDLRQTLAQQLVLLELASTAVGDRHLDRSRTGVFIGMGVDADVARYGARWRAAAGSDRDRFAPPLEAAGVVGTMPNIPANRLNRLLDVGGPSCTVSSEERAGLDALAVAGRAIRSGRLNTALVGAVDLASEPVTEAARRALTGERANRGPTPDVGDGAVVLLISSLAYARANGEPILALVGEEAGGTAEAGETDVATGVAAVQPTRWTVGERTGTIADRTGITHAAAGLLELASLVWGAHRWRTPDGVPWPVKDGAAVRGAVTIDDLDGGHGRWLVQPPGPVPDPRLVVFDGHDRHALAVAVASTLATLGAATGIDPPTAPRPANGLRLCVTGLDLPGLAAALSRAHRFLTTGAPAGRGVRLSDQIINGDLAAVFTSAGSAYHGMGRELTEAFPSVARAVRDRFGPLDEALGWALDETPPTGTESNTDRLWGASALSQLHAQLSRRVLKIEPDAAIGYSSGESAALYAMGAWTDLAEMRHEIVESGLYERELGGTHDAVRRAWGLPPGSEVNWEVWALTAPAELVASAAAGRDRAHLAIVHTDHETVVAGDGDQLERLIAEIDPVRAVPLDYDLAAHVPELWAFHDQWLAIHRRPVTPTPGCRFYSGGRPGAFDPGVETCAQAILGQAVTTLDFRAVIEDAWADGVRIFLEHGPQAACSGWIRSILGPDRIGSALVLPLDHRSQPLSQLLDSVAALVAAGRDVDFGALRAAAAPEPPPRTERSPGRTITLPAHPERIAPRTIGAAIGGSPAGPPIRASGTQRPPIGPQQPSQPTRDRTGPSDDAGRSQDWNPPLPRPATTTAHATLAEIAAVHERYLRTQAEVHQRFLASRRLDHRAPTTGPSASAQSLTSGPVLGTLEHLTPGANSATTPVGGDLEDKAPEPPTPPGVGGSEPRRLPTGLQLDRAQLEVHAGGVISSIFGPAFADQDRFERQVRMPRPPLLLADRVTGIDATPAIAGTGTIWTETDVRSDSWYLHRGVMPAGILIESGQADLLLISYMGADLANRGERVYRLLGCELTFHAPLPRAGDRLAYEIHIDGHARQDDIRLFFFHYDCTVGGRPQISVRHGQAGFFSDDELARSAGILWTAEDAEPCPDPQLDPGPCRTQRREFHAAQVQAFARGAGHDCFGPGFERLQTHTSSPAISDGEMLFIDSVPSFDPTGGPWGRGHLRAEAAVAPDDWYFDGHFLHDPCMPGTLMFEGCLQALSFTMAAYGFTLDRDGWRFQPVIGEPISMRCRGQVTPASRHIDYEVFVEEIVDGPEPIIYADLLCTVDGQKAFHARRVGLQLVPGWPLDAEPALLAAHAPPSGLDTGPSATDGRGFTFDFRSLLACAWGRPSEAFGELYARFDGTERVPRLPGPPYHFLSRIVAVSGAIGAMEVGSSVTVDYEIPPDAWYFDDNGAPTMPHAVLLEAALQPCGWLASAIGSALTVDGELAFRNLDGTATVSEEIFERSGVLRTHVRLTSVSQSAGMIIVGFDVTSCLQDRCIYEMETVFGFFPPEALARQVGLGATDEAIAQVERVGSGDVDLREEPARYFGTSLRLGSGRLRMLDRVTDFSLSGGKGGLGRVRAMRTVDAADWYFKAHFFQDPVQPGSLGIEAMIQTLQFFMIEAGVADHLVAPRFQSIATGAPLTWKYRGQVIPANEAIVVTLDVTAIESEAKSVVTTADASLWCDGIRIYHAEGLAMRAVAGDGDRGAGHADRGAGSADRDTGRGDDATGPAGQGLDARAEHPTIVIDPDHDRWVGDHRPTWTRPALSMMQVVELLADAVPAGERVVGVDDVRLVGWIELDRRRTFHRRVSPSGPGRYQVELLDADTPNPGDTVLASGNLRCGAWSPAPPSLDSVVGSTLDDPYETGALFHGDAFRLLLSGIVAEGASSSILDAGRGSVPIGRLHPALLDAGLHAIPHDDLTRWSDRLDGDRVGFPAHVRRLDVYGPTPRGGTVRCEARLTEVAESSGTFTLSMQLIDGDRVWVETEIVETTFPKGPLGRLSRAERVAFLRDRLPVAGASLSSADGLRTMVNESAIRGSDWMPGTVAAIYGTTDGASIVHKDHLARAEGLHPRHLPEALPLNRRVLDIDEDVTAEGRRWTATEVPGPPRLDLEPVRRYWRERAHRTEGWAGEDLIEGLIERHVGRLVLEDPDGFASLRGRGAIFVANHQVQVESVLISHLLPGLLDADVVTMAHAKHQTRWIGWLLNVLACHPQAGPKPPPIAFFDQQQPASMGEILAGITPGLASGELSFFVHAQGTRGTAAEEPVTRISAAFLDLAVRNELPVVPVRFLCGLPVEPLDGKLELPHGYGRQDYVIGSPIEAADLRPVDLGRRRRLVLERLNAVGLGLPDRPRPSSAVADRVDQWMATAGVRRVEASFATILADHPAPSAETLRLLDRQRDGHPPGDSPLDRWLDLLGGPLWGNRNHRDKLV